MRETMIDFLGYLFFISIILAGAVVWIRHREHTRS